MASNSYQAAAYARVWQIQQMLHPKPSDLISASRFFVREGELSMWNQKKRKKSKRYFFLFNDIMLLTKRQSSKKYLLRIHITLRSPSVSVESVDTASFNWEFRLHCRTRSFILYAASEEDRNFWFSDMEKSVKGTHDEEKSQATAKQQAKTSDQTEVKAPEAITPRSKERTQSVIVTKKKDKDSSRNRSASEVPAPDVARAKSVGVKSSGGSQSSIKKKKTTQDDMHLRSSPGVIQHEQTIAPVPLENNAQTGIFLYPNPMTTNNPFLDVPAVNQNPFATNTFASNNTNPYATNSPFAPGARATVDPALFRNAGFGTNSQPGTSAFGTQTFGSQPAFGQPAPSAFGTQTFGSQPNFGSSSQLTVAASPNPFATTPAPVSTNPFATNNAVAANPNPFATTPAPRPVANPNPFATNPQPATANPFTTPSSSGHFF